jgi:hypothetical protein
MSGTFEHRRRSAPARGRRNVAQRRSMLVTLALVTAICCAAAAGCDDTFQ